MTSREDKAVADLRQRIISAGCDGAFSPERCGCELADLAPCLGTVGMDPEYLCDCMPGYKHDCIGEECADPCDGQGDSFCICESPDGPSRR